MQTPPSTQHHCNIIAVYAKSCVDTQIGSEQLQYSVDIILDHIPIGYKDNRIDSAYVPIVNYYTSKF